MSPITLPFQRQVYHTDRQGSVLSIVHGTFVFRATSELTTFAFLFATPDAGNLPHTVEVTARDVLGMHLANWVNDGFLFPVCPNAIFAADPNVTCHALNRAGVFHHFHIVNPRPLEGPPCPDCELPGCYIGLHAVECLNRHCRHYVPPKHPVGVALIHIPF